MDIVVLEKERREMIEKGKTKQTNKKKNRGSKITIKAISKAFNS